VLPGHSWRTITGRVGPTYTFRAGQQVELLGGGGLMMGTYAFPTDSTPARDVTGRILGTSLAPLHVRPRFDVRVLRPGTDGRERVEFRSGTAVDTLRRRIGNGARLGTHTRGELGEHARVDAVRLGEPAEGTGEVAHLAGVDDRDGHARGGERRHDWGLVAAGGLEHHERGAAADRRERGEPGGGARVAAGRGVVRGRRTAGGAGGEVDVRLGDVDAEVQRIGHVALRGCGVGRRRASGLVDAGSGDGPGKCADSRRPRIGGAPAYPRARGPKVKRATPLPLRNTQTEIQGH
jgi:hypothetical protein